MTRGTPILAILVLVCMMWPLRYGFTDDGYIHIQYARNILEYGEYSFNPGHVSFGTTSPLWVMAQAALGTFVGADESLVHTSRLLSWVAGIVAVLLMPVLARRIGLSVLLAMLAGVALAVHVWFVRWTALGMETSCAVLAMVAVGIAAVGALEQPRRAWALGFAMAAASLIRPEAYLLVPVYLAYVATSRTPGRWGRALQTLAMYGALMLPWLVFARVHIGRFLPNTAGAKSGGLVMSPTAFAHKLVPVAKIVASAEGIFALALIGGLLLLHRNSTLLRNSRRFMLMWVVALPIAYVVFDIQVLSRYMLLISPFVIVLGLAAIEDTARRLPSPVRARRVMAVGAVIVTAAVNIAVYAAVVLQPSRVFSRDLTTRLKSMAVHIRDTTPDGSVVAAADIGYLAFYSERFVLDLGGLVDNVTARLREAHEYEEIVDDGLYLDLPEYPRVDYLIDRVLTPRRFDGQIINGHRFVAVHMVTIGNLGIRKPGPYYYTLYRIERMDDD